MHSKETDVNQVKKELTKTLDVYGLNYGIL